MVNNPYNQGLAPNPLNINQNLAPNPLNSDQNLNQFSFNLCNEGIANGFGPMFFNLRDPTFVQKNDPIKQDPSCHPCVGVFNFIFLICLVVGIVLLIINN